MKDGKVSDIQAKLITKDEAAAVVPDEAITKVVEGIEAEQSVLLNQIVGKTVVALEGAREKVRTGETNLGNLITDAMISATGADCALTNGGGIRASIDAGDITKGEIITVLPFGNYIVTKSVTGADIKAALEHGTGSYPEPLGGFPHVSGITFAIDTGKPVGDRVVDITVKDQPLDLNKKYVLATNDFMAAGGDEYTMFADDAILNEYSALDEAVIAYIQAKGSVSPAAEGRIKVKGSPDAKTEKDSSVAAEKAEMVSNQYIVQPGDWLAKIAKKFNTTWRKLQELNQLRDPNLIFPGQKIVLP